MKQFVEHRLKYYERIFKHPSDVVEHMFATLGNGMELDHKGFIRGTYVDDNEPYEFPEPVAFKFVYPWSDTEEHQPFRDLAGCRNVGFREAAQYFIECIKVTPDDVEYVGKWKENLHMVEDVLLNTPTIEERYTIDDMDKFLDDIKDDNITLNAPVDGTVLPEKESVYKVWYFDVQWSDCPKTVEKEVVSLWQDMEFGNDHYMYKTDVDEELFEQYPCIYFWLKHKGVQDTEKVIVHWWW